MMLATVMAAMMLGSVASGGKDRRDPGDMLPLLKRHEIQVLLSVAMPLTTIAERTGVSLATVKRVRDEAPVEHVDDSAERRRRRIGRPPKAEAFANQVREWLTEEPDLPTQELLRRAKERGYSGGKSAFYAMAASARPPRSAPIVRFEGLPGEFSQHDFGQVDEFQEGLSPTAPGGNLEQPVTGIRYLQRRGDNIMVFSEDYPQGMMCVKTNGDIWIPFTSNTQVEMPNTEEGITGGSPSLFEQCKQTWIQWSNAGGFAYGADAAGKYPETSGHTSCAACIWAALNKNGSDICDWMSIFCPDLQNQGKLIYHTTGYNDIRVPVEQMLPGDLILMDYGGNGRADHVDWYFGNGVVWGAGSAPCPHLVSNDAEHYLQGRSRSIVVELWIVRIFDEE